MKINAREKIYSNKRYKRNTIFRSLFKTRSRIQQALGGKQSSSTINILGINIDTYRKWIENQMTSDITWDIIEIDHVKPICMFDKSIEEELKDAFN